MRLLGASNFHQDLKRRRTSLAIPLCQSLEVCICSWSLMMMKGGVVELVAAAGDLVIEDRKTFVNSEAVSSAYFDRRRRQGLGIDSDFPNFPAGGQSLAAATVG